MSTSALAIAFVLRAVADVPPPPANQEIGIYDTIMEDPTEEDCRACHDDAMPARHHLLLGETIPEGTDAPFGTPGSPYGCTSCHAQDSTGGVIVFLVETDCLVCHVYDPDSRPSAPHHITEEAAARHCSTCHGSVVQDYDDDHYIPDYDISEVTPDPVCKTWEGPTCVSGGCYVCHTEDAAATPTVDGYGDLHHGARFDCALCHDVHGNIRDCEACHGPDSLHNIQADSDATANLETIVPGEENLGWGHIGNGWDCFGCHESFDTAAATAASAATAKSPSFQVSSTPQTGATIPSVSGTSISVVTAGEDSALEIFGSGFINNTGGTVYESEVVLDSAANSLALDITSRTENRIGATVPSELAAGLYDLRVVKGDKKSNREVLAVVPPVVIASIACDKKSRVLTITGSGFGELPAGADAFIGVEVNGQPSDIIDWSDTQIMSSIAKCEKNPTVTVNALMGSTSMQGSGGNGKPKPCRGKSCD